MSNKIRNTILVVSALFILAGTALYLFRLPFTVYIFAAGAVGMTVARATNLYNGSNFRLKRLYRIELIAAIVTVGFCMVHVQTTKRVDFITARCSISTIIHLFYDSKSREERKMTFK